MLCTFGSSQEKTRLQRQLDQERMQWTECFEDCCCTVCEPERSMGILPMSEVYVAFGTQCQNNKHASDCC